MNDADQERAILRRDPAHFESVFGASDGGLQCPCLQARDFKDFRRPEPLAMDDPAAKESGSVFGDVTGWQDFNIRAELNWVSRRQLALLIIRVCNRRQAHEKVCRWDRIRADENTWRNATILLQVVTHIQCRVAKGGPGNLKIRFRLWTGARVCDPLRVPTFLSAAGRRPALRSR